MSATDEFTASDSQERASDRVYGTSQWVWSGVDERPTQTRRMRDSRMAKSAGDLPGRLR